MRDPRIATQAAHIAGQLQALADLRDLPMVYEAAKELRRLDNRELELEAALARLRDCLDGNTNDCVDNSGQPYQSADLANAMENANRVLGRLRKQD